jgi:photosystem II stability/assembly factor-like uncharacterized protein
MFGHLDDPDGVSLGEAQMAAVLRRAHGISVRRRFATLAAVGLLIVAGGAGYVVSRQSTVRLSSAESGYQFNAEKGPLSLGTPVPTTALVNVVFDNAEEGFALAAHRGEAVLAASTNGGSTWQVQNDSLPAGYGQSDGYPGQFEFVGSDGYLWGGAPQADRSAPLWVSSDNGVRWDRAPIGPDVYDVSAIGENVWALTSTCSAKALSTATASCPLVLEQSLDGGASWSAVTSAGFADVTNAPLISQPVELARITTSRAYVLTSNTGSPSADVTGSDIELLYTGDGGQTWQSRPVPCAGPFALGAEVAASGTDDLWFLCGSQASGGDQSKELYRSSDGGSTWVLTASATGLGTPPPPASDPNTLPLGGYVAPFSIGHKNLAVLSPSTAWLYPTRSSLLKTVSGGRSWSAVPDLVAAGFGAGSPGNVTFISATQGWICAYGVGLWHTSDGVHWSALGA